MSVTVYEDRDLKKSSCHLFEGSKLANATKLQVSVDRIRQSVFLVFFIFLLFLCVGLF